MRILGPAAPTLNREIGRNIRWMDRALGGRSWVMRGLAWLFAARPDPDQRLQKNFSLAEMFDNARLHYYRSRLIGDVTGLGGTAFVSRNVTGVCHPCDGTSTLPIFTRFDFDPGHPISNTLAYAHTQWPEIVNGRSPRGGAKRNRAKTRDRTCKPAASQEIPSIYELKNRPRSKRRCPSTTILTSTRCEREGLVCVFAALDAVYSND